MGIWAHPLARVRRVSLSRPGYLRLALATVAMLVLIVATGATVRLTGSGLGCEHWPGCTGAVSLPAKGYHSYIEFSNRLIAFVTILVTLAAWLGALAADTPKRVRVLAFATFYASSLGRRLLLRSAHG